MISLDEEFKGDQATYKLLKTLIKLDVNCNNIKALLMMAQEDMAKALSDTLYGETNDKKGFTGIRGQLEEAEKEKKRP